MALVWRGGEADDARLRSWFGLEVSPFATGERLPLTHYDNFHGEAGVF